MSPNRNIRSKWRQYFIALTLILLGGGCWLVGLGVALGESPKWIEDIANIAWEIIGPTLVVIGIVWVIVHVAGPILFPPRINRD